MRAIRASSLAGRDFPPKRLISIATREGSPMSEATEAISGTAFIGFSLLTDVMDTSMIIEM
jgi:hypothetical protein